LVLKQALGENCQFFIRQVFTAYAIFSMGKKLFQELKFWNSLHFLPFPFYGNSRECPGRKEARKGMGSFFSPDEPAIRC
jgi:hypothetical protein